MNLIKKLTPFVILILSFLIILTFWESIKLPYNYQNSIFGEYKVKEFNHLNDSLRFITLNFVPLTIFFIFGTSCLFFKDNLLISLVTISLSYVAFNLDIIFYLQLS